MSSLESISADLTSIARFKYTRLLAAGWVVKKLTTEAPERSEHLLRLR